MKLDSVKEVQLKETNIECLKPNVLYVKLLKVFNKLYSVGGTPKVSEDLMNNELLFNIANSCSEEKVSHMIHSIQRSVSESRRPLNDFQMNRYYNVILGSYSLYRYNNDLKVRSENNRNIEKTKPNLLKINKLNYVIFKEQFPLDTAIDIYNTSDRIMLLNDASSSIGGGFLIGCSNMEEELCRCTTLYNHVTTRNFSQVTTTKGVLAFRRSAYEGYTHIDPIDISIVSAVVKKNPKKNKFGSYKEFHDIIDLYKKIFLIYVSAEYNKVSDLIVNALGCSKSHHPYSDVAFAFLFIIYSHSWSFKTHMSVIENHNTTSDIIGTFRKITTTYQTTESRNLIFPSIDNNIIYFHINTTNTYKLEFETSTVFYKRHISSNIESQLKRDNWIIEVRGHKVKGIFDTEISSANEREVKYSKDFFLPLFERPDKDVSKSDNIVKSPKEYQMVIRKRKPSCLKFTKKVVSFRKRMPDNVIEEIRKVLNQCSRLKVVTDRSNFTRVVFLTYGMILKERDNLDKDKIYKLFNYEVVLSVLSDLISIYTNIELYNLDEAQVIINRYDGITKPDIEMT